MNYLRLEHPHSLKNMAVFCSILYAILGLCVAITENNLVSWIIGAWLLISCFVHLFVFNEKFNDSFSCSIILGFLSWQTLGHTIASIWSFFLLFAGESTFRHPITPIVLSFTTMASFWYKNFRQSFLTENNPTTEKSRYVVFPSNETNKTHFYFVAIISAFIWGLAEARLNNGYVPHRYFSEGFIGLVTAAILFTFSDQKIWEFRKAQITTFIMFCFSFIYTITTIIFYALRSKNRYLHFQYGFAMLLAIVYMLSFVASFISYRYLNHKTSFKLFTSQKTPAKTPLSSNVQAEYGSKENKFNSFSTTYSVHQEC